MKGRGVFMFSILKDMILMVLSFFKYPLIIIGVIIVLFIISFIYFYAKGLIEGRRIKRGAHKQVKESGLLKQIFVEVPRTFINDVFERDPDEFGYKGLVIYTGSQGSGKTIAMVHDMMMMQKEYPLCKCITNIKYTKQDASLNDWRQLIDYKNGIYGVIVGLDEVQNWFSSKQSKDFPPEMFEVVTQNRKNRRIILATTQNFYQPSKDIRAQCTQVRRCLTLLNVFTIVHVVRPELDSNGDVSDWHHVRYYSFVHSKEIRDSYDTYQVIESLAKSGFKPRLPENQVINNITITKKAASKSK